MAPLTWWTWVWASSVSWWWTGKPGMLQSMGSQRVGHDWATQLNWIDFWTPTGETMSVIPFGCNNSWRQSGALQGLKISFEVFLIIYFGWRQAALQCCIGFCYTSTWISHRYTYASSLLKLSPTFLPILQGCNIGKHFFFRRERICSRMPMPVVRPWAGRSRSHVAFYAFPLRTIILFSAGLGMKLRSSCFMNAIDKLISSIKPPEHPRTKTSPWVSVTGSYLCMEITNCIWIADVKTQQKSTNGIHVLGQESSDYFMRLWNSIILLVCLFQNSLNICL